MSSSSCRIASLASNSVARACGVPLGRMVSLSMLVFISTSDISALPSSRSSRPGPGGQAQHAQDRRPGHVGIDQHDGVVQFGGDAHRQVHRGEALALAGHGAGHHDQVAVGQRRGAPAHGVADQRALDDAVLVGDVRARCVGRDDAGGLEHGQVEFDAARRHRRPRRCDRRRCCRHCCRRCRQRSVQRPHRRQRRQSPAPSTPARRSCSRRWAACSIRLLIVNPPFARP